MPLPRSSITAAGITALFLAAVAGPAFWFSLGPTQPQGNLRLSVRESLDGWTFTNRPITETALAVLATTNVLNGDFVDANGRRVSVFAAHWPASHGRGMGVLMHTPDICWAQAGWKHSKLEGIPIQFPIRIATSHATGEDLEQSVELSFECRVFESPGSQGRELVMWCAVAFGAPYSEPAPISLAMEPSEGSLLAGIAGPMRRSQLSIETLMRSVKTRSSAQGDKQFVRVSASVSNERLVQADVDALKTFAQRWLLIQRGP